MTDFFSKTIHVLLKQYKSISLILVILYIASLIPICLFFKVDTSLKTWFLENDSDYAAYLKFQEDYGSDDLITVLVEVDGNVFDPTNLSELQQTEKDLSKLPFVDQVFGLTSVKYFRSAGSSVKSIPVVDSLTEPANKIKRKLIKSPMGAAQFVLEDGKHTMIYVVLKKVDELEKDRDGLTDKIHGVLSNHFDEYHIAGMAIINEVVNKMVMEESAFFSLFTSALIFFTLWVYFRRIGYVLIIMTAVTLPVTFLISVFFLTGHQLNSIAIVIPTILMVYAVADGVHIINNYLYHSASQKKGDKKETIINSLLYSIKPCFYTSLTTAASYMAFFVSSLKVLREMGIFAAIGIMLAFCLAFIVIGCGLMWLPPPKEDMRENKAVIFTKNNWFFFVDKNKTSIFIGAMAIVLFSFPLIEKITVGDNFMEYMKDDSTVKEDIYAVQKLNGGFLPFEFLVRSTDGLPITSQEKLRSITEFQNKLVEDSLLVSPFSLVDIIKKAKNNEPENILLRIKLDDEKELEKMFTENRNLPESQLAVLTNTDLTEIRITGKSQIYGSHQFQQKIEAAKNIFKNMDGANAGLEMKPQGFLPLYVKMINFITSSQVTSFLMAFAFVLTCLFICFRNIKIVLLSILPNLIPISVTIITMVFLDWRLDTATVMIAAIILGIAVDDTIHFLHAYIIKKKNGESHTAAVSGSMEITGRAIRLTSLALIAGFLTIGFSEIKNLQHFGILSGLAVLIALVADFIVLPAVLLKFDK